MRKLAILLALLPIATFAQDIADWQPLAGPAITSALTARVVGYENGSMQNFFADGRTLYEVKAGASWGKWKVENNQYCSVWPPSEHWECYGVEAETAGIGIRFISLDGTLSRAKYVDLQ